MDERLREAIETGDEEVVKALVAGETGLADATDETGVAAVLFALYRGHGTIARHLLGARSRPADVFEAAALGRVDELDRILADDDSAPGSRSPDGFTPLHLAAFFGRADASRRLLAAGADVEAVAENPSRVRPLHSAVAGGDVATVEALLDAGVDVEVKQHGGFTPLMGAAAGGSETLVRRLLERGADVEATSDDGKTAADFARERGHEGLVPILG